MTKTPIKNEIRPYEEHVRVEHHPVARPAPKVDLAAITEGIIEVTATPEEPAVSRHVRVVEERTETVRGTVRRTEVNVERTGAAQAPEARFEA